MIKKIIYFMTTGIWLKSEVEYQSKYIRIIVRQVKVMILTIKGFGEHDILLRSAGLTFYTLMSIVPIAALIFAIVKGFGLDVTFQDDLYSNFPEYKGVITTVIEFANNMLMRTKGGILASFGMVVLLWAVIKVFSNIEEVFNHIWEVKNQRTIARKISDYLTIIFIAPILWIISNSLALLLKSELTSYTGGGISNFLYGLGSLVSLWFMFTFIYYAMPNTKVKFTGALVAGVMAGTVFQLFQIAYIYIQTQVSSYNAIYGSFAALPLFLIWLQSSWQILLSGAELSFAYQNISKYEQERNVSNINYDNRRKIMIATMVTVIKNFKDNKGAISTIEISEDLNLPVRIVRDVIFDMERANLLLSVKNLQDEKVNLYIPSRDIHNLTILDVINAVEDNNKAHVITPDILIEITSVSTALDNMRNDIYSSVYNRKLIDLIENE